MVFASVEGASGVSDEQTMSELQSKCVWTMLVYWASVTAVVCPPTVGGTLKEDHSQTVHSATENLVEKCVSVVKHR